MGITHAEFFRVIAQALEGRRYRIDTDRVVVEDDGGALEITLSEESERRIALMTIPVTRVRLTFTGYGEARIAETLTWFDRWFQRGGG